MSKKNKLQQNVLIEHGVRPVIDAAYETSRHWRQSLILLLDIIFIPLAFVLAVVARWGDFTHQFSMADALAVFTTMVVSVVFFRRIGFYRAIIRFMGQQAIMVIIQGVSVSALALAVACYLFNSEVPRSTPLIYWCFALLLIGSSRFLVRAFYHSVLRKAGDNVAIYGAGASGRQLLTALYHSGDFRPVVFIDDSGPLQGSVINGLSIYSSEKLPELIDKFALTHVYLALPSVERERRREILDELESLSVHVKTVPDFEDLVSGQASVAQLQDIEIEDLLGRDAVPPQKSLIERCISGKVVMVTGGGGSIGSELCRQILHCRPKELLILDISEYSLYRIAKDLERIKVADGLETNIITLLGSVRDQTRMESIFKEFSVETIYHAAAYKHVPMVEYNMAEGVANNVFGTLSASRAAVAAGVKTFVLISTDKAVRPTNVMGASKRFAELVLQAFAHKYSDTHFSMVRFGNVLGSSGSVVPLFRQQIKNGGPVTVTHKDIVRYFMTIPEAAQLVLQASALGKKGDVFVLDMGEPVKIVYLARRLIHLMGCEVKDKKHPRGNIEIEFTGLRPGEKLYEELLLGDQVTGTEHPKILRAEEASLSEAELDPYLERLQVACTSNDCDEIQKTLLEAVDGFEAKDGISDTVWHRQRSNGLNKQSEQEDNIITASFPKLN